MLVEVAGVFVKIAFAEDADIVLARGLASRPAARFNRPGQDALYLSPDEISDRVAIGEYVKAEDRPRVLLHYEVERCMLVDLRNSLAADIYAKAGQPWRSTFSRGEEPASWHAAEAVRQAGHVGLIDPSRRRLGLWHITLLRWNEPGAPTVRSIGSPAPITAMPDQR